MKITDRIYGTFDISEPVLLELITSKPVQRLKDISQQGVPAKYYDTLVFSRHEHSIGVMLLLRSLGASLEEQIAGLIHDISHTVFSHVVDYITIPSTITESAQDLRHSEFVKKSEVKGILENYGLNLDKISDLENNGLLDRHIPNLCADRIDYSMRYFPQKQAEKLFAKLTTKDDKVVMKDKKSAKEFAEFFLNLQMNVWGAYENSARYVIMAEILKIGLNKGIITDDDLFKEEKEIMERLLGSGNERIIHLFHVLERKSLKDLPILKSTVVKKFRYVDPEYLEGNEVKILSKTDKEFSELLQKSKLENEKGIHIPDLTKI